MCAIACIRSWLHEIIYLFFLENGMKFPFLGECA